MPGCPVGRCPGPWAGIEPVVFTACSQCGAAGEAVRYQPVDVLQLLPVDDRPQGDLSGRRIPDRQVPGLLCQLGNVLIGNGFVHDMAAGRHADLSLVKEGAPGTGGGCQIAVGIFEDDDGVIAAELQVSPLQMLCCRGADVASGRRRTGEGDDAGGFVGDQSNTGPGVTGDHLQDACGQARLFKHAGDRNSAAYGSAGVRFEDDGVSQCQGRGNCADGQEQGEVEGGNYADHTDGNASAEADPGRVGRREKVALGPGREGCRFVAFHAAWRVSS